MRTLSWLLALSALAVGLALAMLHDAGYLLLVLPPWRIEISLNLFILLLLGGFLGVDFLVRAVLHTLRLPRSVREFRARRAREQAESALRDALGHWLNGRYAQSLKSAERAYRSAHDPGLAALLAWRSAHALRDQARCLHWQAQALTHDAEIRGARLMTAAELALEDRDFQSAQEALTELTATSGRHIAALRLLLRAQRGLGQWHEVVHLVRHLHKHHAFVDAQALPLLWAAHREHIKSLRSDGRALVAYWAQLPEAEQGGAGLAREMAAALLASAQHVAAQAVIEEALDENWDSALIARYADCQGGDLLGRIARAEAWLPEHPRDAALLLSLGRLCQQQLLWGKAQSYLEAALALENSVQAQLELARLFDTLGRGEEADRLYRAAALAAH